MLSGLPWRLALLVLASSAPALAAPSPIELRSERGSALLLRLELGASHGSDGVRAAFGFVSVKVAFDDLAHRAPLARGDASDDAAPAFDEAAPPRLPAALAQPAAAAPARQTRPLAAHAASEPLARLSPRLARDAVRAALAFQRLDQDERWSSMAARSRSRAALPELGLRGGTSSDASLRFAPIASDPARVTRSGARDLWLEARLTWRLDRALFSPDEVAIERLRWNGEQARERLARRVLRLLVEWQRAELRRHEPLLSDEQHQRAWLDALAAAAELDVLTDGWFSRRLGLE